MAVKAFHVKLENLAISTPNTILHVALRLQRPLVRIQSGTAYRKPENSTNTICSRAFLLELSKDESRLASFIPYSWLSIGCQSPHHSIV